MKAAETRLLSQGKIKTLGLIFRHETRNFCEATAVLCYYTGSPHPKRTLFHLRKTEKDFLIVACIIVADVSATIIRKFRDQGSKFSNETQRVCLRPLLLFWKSFAV